MQHVISEPPASPLWHFTAGALRPLLLALCLALVTPPAAPTCADSTRTDARVFLESVLGEWIGTCRQSTDGEQAEDKYFHAVVREIGPNTFSTTFEYFRLKNGTPVKVGASSIATTVCADGTAANRVTGEGVVLVEKKPKNQRHDFTETVRPVGDGRLEGQGAGKIIVSGMPMGLGKNGKIRDSRSSWSLADGRLTISQTITAGFSVLFFTKTFSVVAQYSAVRGANLASIYPKQAQSALRAGGLGAM